MAIALKVNGEGRNIDADPDTPLLWVLRDTLGLTGTKYGCGIAQCGACMVHLDGKPVLSCQMSLADVGSKAVTTIENVSGRAADAVRLAWQEIDVVQCGYCQSGQIMAATALLQSNARPTDEDINRAMGGNICRCATYQRIQLAVRAAAKRMEG